MIVQIESTGLLRVAEAEEVGRLTEQGYKLRAVFQDNVVRQVEKALPPLDPHDRYAQPRIVYEKERMPAVRYLMELDSESAIAHLTREKDDLEQATTRLASERNTAKNEAAAAAEELTKTKGLLERLDKEVHLARGQRRELETTNRRYELALGKLREILGTERFTSIVGDLKRAGD